MNKTASDWSLIDDKNGQHHLSRNVMKPLNQIRSTTLSRNVMKLS